MCKCVMCACAYACARAHVCLGMQQRQCVLTIKQTVVTIKQTVLTIKQTVFTIKQAVHSINQAMHTTNQAVHTATNSDSPLPHFLTYPPTWCSQHPVQPDPLTWRSAHVAAPGTSW